MNKVPLVFISSVSEDLIQYREKMFDIITQDFGWDSYPFGICNENYPGNPIRSSLKEVNNADLYVGIFRKDAGTNISTYNMPLTELECRTAINKRKAMLIYVIEADSDKVDIDIDLLLLSIRDPENGLFINFCKNFNDLIYQFSKDLNKFGNAWVAGNIEDWKPTFLLDTFLEDLGIFTKQHQLVKSPSQGLNTENSSFPIDNHFILRAVEELENLYNLWEYEEVLNKGYKLIGILHRRNIFVKKTDFMPLLARFLELWIGSCTWLNLFDGKYGANHISKILMEIYHQLEWWRSMYQTASRISNCSYVYACSLENKILLLKENNIQFYGRGKNQLKGNNKLQNKFEKERQIYLQKALDYNDFYVERFRPSGLHLYRAYIYQVQGNYVQAVKDFELLNSYKAYNGNELSYLDTLADLGYTKGLLSIKEKSQKLKKESLKHLTEAYEKVQNYPTSPFSIIIEKEFAKGLLLFGNKRDAKKLLDELYHKAVDKGLSQQAEALLVLSYKSRK